MSAEIDVKTDGVVGRFRWMEKSPFGVEIEGDASQPLSKEEQATLSSLLYTNGFLLLRNQQLDKAQFRAFGGSLAPLLPEEHEANPIIAVDNEIGAFGRLEFILHRDLAFAEYPFQAIALHAIDVTDGETSTFFASCMRAYRLLPDELKARLAGLQVITALGTETTKRIRESELIMSPGWPRYVHKLVSPHPVTGEPGLLVCNMSSVRIESMSAEASEELLTTLLKYVEDAGNIYEHKWRNGDLLIWDNFDMLHARKFLEGVKNRTMQRVTLGKRSFPMSFPHFSMRKYCDTYRGADFMGKNSGGRF